jgi:hypothetical protein
MPSRWSWAIRFQDDGYGQLQLTISALHIPEYARRTGWNSGSRTAKGCVHTTSLVLGHTISLQFFYILNASANLTARAATPSRCSWAVRFQDDGYGQLQLTISALHVPESARRTSWNSGSRTAKGCVHITSLVLGHTISLQFFYILNASANLIARAATPSRCSWAVRFQDDSYGRLQLTISALHVPESARRTGWNSRSRTAEGCVHITSLVLGHTISLQRT